MFIHLITAGELYKTLVITSEIVLFTFSGFVLRSLLFGVAFFVFTLNHGMWMLAKFRRRSCGYPCSPCNHKWLPRSFVTSCEHYRLKCIFHVLWLRIAFVYIRERSFGYLLDFVDVRAVIGFLFRLPINGFRVFICRFVFDWRLVMFTCEKCIFLYCVGSCGARFRSCTFVRMVIEFIDVRAVIVLNLYHKWIFTRFRSAGTNLNFVRLYKLCSNQG